jgi:hypothetical protein
MTPRLATASFLLLVATTCAQNSTPVPDDYREWRWQEKCQGAVKFAIKESEWPSFLSHKGECVCVRAHVLWCVCDCTPTAAITFIMYILEY